MAEGEFFVWSEVPASDSAGVQRREIRGTGASLKQITIAAGTRADRHSHDFEQFLLILQGRLTLTTAVGETELRPGMVAHFDPQAWHAAVFIEDTVLVEVNLQPAA